ncbi:MAG TPA: hypothetical protein VGX23_07325 [Actinocrinis sp.]|nr:hypothetical protein [Actinocrinis sp.]
MSPYPDHLPSWNDTPTRRAITAFVEAVADEHGPAFVPPAERIAVFDNDGTLWLYGIPPERVIGSALGLDFDQDAVDDDAADVTRLVYKSTTEFLDDGPQKPIRIWSRTGRRPLLACGNANGDVPMMRFARTGERTGLRLLVLHDDADREFAYTAGAEDALDRARSHDWTVISMKNDWATVTQ